MRAAPVATPVSHDPHEHRHRWTGVAFELLDDRAWVRSTCDCGAQRRVRAFERFWDPDEDDDAHRHPA